MQVGSQMPQTTPKPEPVGQVVMQCLDHVSNCLVLVNDMSGRLGSHELPDTLTKTAELNNTVLGGTFELRARLLELKARLEAMSQHL